MTRADSVDGYRFYDVAVDGLSYEESDGTGIGTITVRNSVNSGNSLSFTKNRWGWESFKRCKIRFICKR